MNRRNFLTGMGGLATIGMGAKLGERVERTVAPRPGLHRQGRIVPG